MRHFQGMKHLILSLALIGLSSQANATCYADYKASMDNPFRLHYGVILVPDNLCSTSAAWSNIAGRLAPSGWQLLEIMSIFDENGLTPRRIADAGQYYLAF